MESSVISGQRWCEGVCGGGNGLWGMWEESGDWVKKVEVWCVDWRSLEGFWMLCAGVGKLGVAGLLMAESF